MQKTFWKSVDKTFINNSVYFMEKGSIVSHFFPGEILEVWTFYLESIASAPNIMNGLDERMYLITLPAVWHFLDMRNPYSNTSGHKIFVLTDFKHFYCPLIVYSWSDDISCFSIFLLLNFVHEQVEFEWSQKHSNHWPHAGFKFPWNGPILRISDGIMHSTPRF